MSLFQEQVQTVKIVGDSSSLSHTERFSSQLVGLTLNVISPADAALGANLPVVAVCTQLSAFYHLR
jgi:hypothetical protein